MRKCGTCGSSAPIGDICTWCGKPEAVQPAKEARLDSMGRVRREAWRKEQPAKAR